MASYNHEAIETARKYYNSEDADNFYFNVWGGEDLHLGIYKYPEEPIFGASRRSVKRMISKYFELDDTSNIIDLGGGYGGSMRYIVKTYGCSAVVLNLSEKENERDRRMNKEQGADHLMEVVDGAYEEVPYEGGAFDLVFSEDCILHSPHREKVLQEAYRLLKPGGEFVFADPMQTDDCPDGVLQPIYDRIQLQSLASPGFYRETAENVGFEVSAYEDLSIHLPRHYQAVHDELERREQDIRRLVSQEYIDNMKAGLKHWVNGGENGYLAWGIFHLIKK